MRSRIIGHGIRLIRANAKQTYGQTEQRGSRLPTIYADGEAGKNTDGGHSRGTSWISDRDYIIDDQEAGLFRVNRRAFTDPECLAEERRRIFDKCWIYVGHESEVPHAGDYRSRNVAGRPMILVRGDDSVVRVLLNTCTHRGVAGVPAESPATRRPSNAPTMRGPITRAANWSAFRARTPIARLSSARTWRWSRRLRSITIADSFSPALIAAAHSLYDYLAGAREYLDLVADQSELGMKIVAGPAGL